MLHESIICNDNDDLNVTSTSYAIAIKVLVDKFPDYQRLSDVWELQMSGPRIEG